jgi:hypothetical protein
MAQPLRDDLDFCNSVARLPQVKPGINLALTAIGSAARRVP